MNKKLQAAIGVLMLCLPLFTIAKSKTTRKKVPAKTHFRLLEAYTQRTLPGIAGAKPSEPTYHFVIVWQTTGNIESCFWRGDNGWMTCNVERVHKLNPKDARNFPPGTDYIIADAADEVHKGDTVAISPMKGGKFPIPAEIPASAKNTLYYKTGGTGKWIAFPIKTIGKKPDIAMP